MLSPKTLKIRSGGQTGVDRAALDVAEALQFDSCGWCPRHGLAEDMPNPPGLLKDYPQLQETEATDYYERTRLNVEDADATLILASSHKLAKTGGTGFTERHARKIGSPCKSILLQDAQNFSAELAQTRTWLEQQMESIAPKKNPFVLNIAGPRESKSPGIYELSYAFLMALLQEPSQ